MGDANIPDPAAKTAAPWFSNGVRFRCPVRAPPDPSGTAKSRTIAWQVEARIVIHAWLLICGMPAMETHAEAGQPQRVSICSFGADRLMVTAAPSVAPSIQKRIHPGP